MTLYELKNSQNILFEALSGSYAYGLNLPSSDKDIRGVFYSPKEEFFGFTRAEQISDEKSDIVYFELERFVSLLLKNNPTALELLATPKDCVIYKSPLMEKLKIENFLSKLCKNSFAGYATAQIRKAKGLNKKINKPQPEIRKSFFDFCYCVDEGKSILLSEWLDRYGVNQEQCGLSALNHFQYCYALYVGDGYKGVCKKESANEPLLSSIPKGKTPQTIMTFNQDAYTLHCKEHKEYWEWVKNRNDERYKTNIEVGKEYDTKNMMHTIRLLKIAKEIAEYGELRVRREDRDFLLSIRAGKYSYEELLNMAEELVAQAEEAFDKSSLPDAPDYEAAEMIIVEIRSGLY